MAIRLAACLAELTIAAGCGQPTRILTETSEPAMPPTPTGETPPGPDSPAPEPELDLAAEKRAVLSVVESYVRAIAARDEATAARYTCQKKNGGMLWLSSAGKPIAVLGEAVVGGHMLGYLAASVDVQVDGEAPSEVVVHKVDGIWCVWL